MNRLEEALKAQREFTADAAHELRTPLAILRTHIDTKLDPVIAKELQADVSATVRILDQLLELAELEATSTSGWGDADLRELCTGVVALMAPLAIAEGKSVEFSGADGRLIVWCNADMITRALRNLVENAIRFSPSGGAVEVELAAPDAILVKDRGPESGRRSGKRFSAASGERIARARTIPVLVWLSWPRSRKSTAARLPSRTGLAAARSSNFRSPATPPMTDAAGRAIRQIE